MNELMLALEAMITRIVRAEMQAATAAVATTPLTAGPAFDQMVRTALIDKVWFTDAVRSEVVDNMESTQSNVIRDTVVNDSTIADYITDMINDVKEEGFRTRVEQVIDNYIDVEDQVNDAIRNLSFSVSVE